MRRIEEIGTCPKCECSISMFKTSNHKRFAKCEVCGTSYALPKRGELLNSVLTCPLREFPILIVDRKEQQAYFWADQPCFNCIAFDNCEPIHELITEFKELEVHGF
jgi:hypothetical protein